MAIVKNLDALLSFNTSKKLGFSGGFGAIAPGYNRFGFYDIRAGIYQRKKTLKGYRTSRMAFYRPTNPQTVAQQAWRATFAAGMVAYAALTPTEKGLLFKAARSQRISASNLFLRKWLQSRR